MLLGKPTKGCRNLLDSDDPVPEGYGAYGLFRNSLHQLTVRVNCGFSRAVLQVGTGDSDEFINPDAFLRNDGEWRPIDLKGEERADDGWHIGAASANLRLSGPQLREEQQVLRGPHRNCGRTR